MATNFPNSVDSLTNPTTSDTLATVSHSGQHADANDAIEAIQTALLDGSPLKIDDANNRVGIGTTAPTDTLDVNGTLNVRDHLDFSDTTPAASNLVTIFPHGYDFYVDNAGAGGNSTRFWLDTPDAGEVVIGPRAGASTLGNTRIRSDNISLEGDATVTGSLYLSGLASTPVGEYQSYTPSFFQSSTTIGNGTASGKYCRIGDMVHATALIEFGSTTYFNPRYARISTPVSGIAGTTSMAVSYAALFDAVNGYYYTARVDIYDSSGNFRISAFRAMTASADSGITSGYYADLSNDVTLGNGSYILIRAVYQAA